MDLEAITTLKRAANRIKREVLRRPPVRFFWDMAYEAELGRHASLLPWLGHDQAALVDAIRRDGSIVTDLKALGIAGTDAMIARATALVPELAARPTAGGNAIRLPLDRLIASPEIYLWGLDAKLLDTIETYVGLPLMYHGADLRRELPDGRATDVRQWHIDAEDKRMFKIILYLNDVDVDGGPFAYMTKAESARAAGELRYGSGFVSDEVMARVVPRDRWKLATASAGSAAIADTCQIFHRATPPTARDRFSVTFSFSSRRPVKIYDTVVLSAEQMAPILGRLTARQRSCLPPSYL